MEYGHDNVDEAVLALLYLTLYKELFERLC